MPKKNTERTIDEVRERKAEEMRLYRYRRKETKLTADLFELLRNKETWTLYATSKGGTLKLFEAVGSNAKQIAEINHRIAELSRALSSLHINPKDN